MERIGIHELSAAYALDALDGDDRREFEEHLTHCAECRDAVASFQEAASNLAFGAEMPPPPPELKGRILEQARRERSNVIPMKRRWALPAAATVAAVAASAAIVLGIWAASLHDELGQRPEAVPISGASGSLIVTHDNEATLVVRDLPPAPAGKTYEAWVIQGGKPAPAGTFAGGDRVAFQLTRNVANGAVVAVTIERAGGVRQPTTNPLITSEPV
jgi:anti-sigma-K factor RskA